MPTKEPKIGRDRSGRGTGAPAHGKPLVKNFDPPRYPFYHGTGGSPSSSADTSINRFGQTPYGPDDAYQGGDDVTVKYPNRLAAMNDRDRKAEELDEMSLRLFVRTVLSEVDDVDLPEVSTLAGGAISGYTLPLGAEPIFPKKKRKKKSRK